MVLLPAQQCFVPQQTMLSNKNNEHNTSAIEANKLAICQRNSKKQIKTSYPKQQLQNNSISN